MGIRNFLLVDSSRSIRTMIKKYVFAELGDVEIVESDCGQDARNHLFNHSFDLVICNSDLADMHIIDLQMEAIKASSKNKAATCQRCVKDLDHDTSLTISLDVSPKRTVISRPYI